MDVPDVPDVPEGLCPTMCPRSEFEIRSRERLLHPLETHAEDAVKRYARSAAGLDLTRRELLRPYPVLLRTVNHLLKIAISDTRLAFPVVHGFVADRLRCVAQDAAVQRLGPDESATLYESMLRYHVYSAPRLCGEEPSAYDPVWHAKATAEYLNRLLRCYDNLDGVPSPKNQSVEAESVRPLMESVNLIFNIGRPDPLFRYFKIPKDCRTSTLKISFQISLCYMMRNYIRIFELSSKLPALLSCALALHLPAIRRMAFEVMRVGFNSKNLTYPVDKLKTLLHYDTEAELIEDLTYYSISVIDEGIQFKKENHDSKLKTKMPKCTVNLDSKILNVKNDYPSTVK